jgi:putative transposase
MPRVARIVVPGTAHHVTQRGNNRQDVFFTDDDRRFYLKTLREQSQRFGLSVRGWCLMTNHVHLVVVPAEPDSLASAVGRTHWLYTQYVNRLHGRGGHLWQNRFFSCPLDGEHEEAAIRYAERNPARARLVRLPWKYRWSSAAAHCGLAGRSADESGLLHDLAAWRRRYPGSRWSKILQSPEDQAMLTRLRRRTYNGRPLGTDRFIARLESLLNRRLRDPKMGRPRKEKVKARKPGTPRRRSIVK